jgi:drug/metabolite transporter (DMT)-like permease
MLGAALIVLGAFLLTGDPRQLVRAGSGSAYRFAVATGFLIACYTVFDKYAVASLLIPPLVFDVGANALRALLLVPYSQHHDQGGIRRAWANHRSIIIVIAILSPLSYILVLTAMVTTPVSYVAPLREVSILIAAFLGAHVLAEGDLKRRLLASAIMVCGAVLIAR